MNEYKCTDCETSYHTSEDKAPPTPKWVDGHVCTLELVEDKDASETKKPNNSLEKNFSYLEGLTGASGMIKYIENTSYGSLENAIKVKTELVEHFEKEFGYSREDEEIDPKYAYTLGLLDALTKALKDES